MTTQSINRQVQKNPVKLVSGFLKQYNLNENRSLRLIKNHIDYLDQRLKNVSK